MRVRRIWRSALSMALTMGGAAVSAASCGGSSSSVGLAASCALKSDCDSPLVCVFSRCHQQCNTSDDCSAGERCVSSGESGANVCQLQEETSCATASCAGTQVCTASDMQCRMPCQTTLDCRPGQYCVAVSSATTLCYQVGSPSDQSVLLAAGVIGPDGAVITDASASSVIDAVGVGSGEAGAGDGTVPEGDGASGDSTVADVAVDGPGADHAVGDSCPSAQTQFGNIAQGDANPNFTSGVGLRTATQMLVFSGESESTDAGDGGAVNNVYVQAFDPLSGASAGPAHAFFAASGAGSTIQVQSAAIAPTGEAVVVFGFSTVMNSAVPNGMNAWWGRPYVYADDALQQGGLYAAFLAPSADAGAGAGGLGVRQIVTLETAPTYGQPHAVWAPAAQAFVLAWEYTSGGALVKVKKYLVDGRSAGGGTDLVPTISANSYVDINAEEQGSVGVVGSLSAAAYNDDTYGNPSLTLLDALGSPVGNPFAVSTVTSPTWTTVGGVQGGFVVLFDTAGGVSEAYVPTAGDAGAMLPSDGGLPAGFTFPGSVRAVDARVVNDDTGGPGGVGVALLYSNGVSFAYVQPDGIGHLSPSSVIPHAYVAGDQVHISQFAGSFAISGYSSAEHLTRIAASGCQ